MRRTAAVLATLLTFIVSPEVAASSPQLVLQAGPVGRFNDSLNQVGMTMDCVFLSSSVIGEWLEFGVLRRDAAYYEYGYGSVGLPLEGGTKVLATNGSGSFENLELSYGFVLGPAGSPSFSPYLKAGIGAYREVIPPPVLKLGRASTNAIELPFLFPTEMRWDAGASIGFGARFGKAGTMSPTVEVRLHFTRLDSEDAHKLLAVTGGLWFR